MNYFALVFCGKRSGGPGRVTAAGLFLYRRCANEYEYLLLKSAKDRDKHWTPPEGRLIDNKTFLDTAKIVTNKMTGYTSADYDVFEHHKYMLKCCDAEGTRKTTMYYLTELSNRGKQPALRAEHHSGFAWATPEDACRLIASVEQKLMFRFFRDVVARGREPPPPPPFLE